MTHEIPQLTAAIEQVDRNIKLMVLIVNKRVSQRFFNNGGHRLNNPDPGTVISQGVVSEDSYDFYLVSTLSRQGVVSPTHYTVIYDTIKDAQEKVQLLTYKLCFTYYNVSGSIKVPAPIQYASRLASLVGDRAKGKGDVPIPHKHFGNNLKSLYFI